MYAVVTHFFRKHTHFLLVIFLSSVLSACGNKGPLIVPDAVYENTLSNILFISNNNDS